MPMSQSRYYLVLLSLQGGGLPLSYHSGDFSYNSFIILIILSSLHPTYKIISIMTGAPISEKSLEIVRATAPLVKENSLKITTTVSVWLIILVSFSA